ncbi:hypothetical protein GBAR_LOCUS5435 [Geodia barretti]|uniref:Cyclic nucleotide-binding domain-containing protein n=1 Tax=Geodia barretti TaxID=519541 RepID=A0AA35WAQ7_GEOBA|nr:hypothetical protein GBAR_LOCUS5435 [Geodia barretti]
MVYRTNVSYISHFLREVDMFSGLSERNLDRIASLCEEYTFAPEEHLGMQDEHGTNLYVIRDGEIRVSVGSQDTGVVVRTVREKETFPDCGADGAASAGYDYAGGYRSHCVCITAGQADGAVRA